MEKPEKPLPGRPVGVMNSELAKLVMAVSGILLSLLCYGVMQERIMRVPYGDEHFRYSLLLVLFNRLLSSAVCIVASLGTRQKLAPVAPMYAYAAVSLSNVIATTCQYEALKYVSFPVQTLGKCAKMMPVMIWGTLIMQKRYGWKDYLIAFLVTAGCTIFVLTGESSGKSSSKDDSLWGLILMGCYLGTDGFTSTFQDKLFKGYNMDIFNQVLYVALCSSAFSVVGLVSSGELLPALAFLVRHPTCLRDNLLLSAAATSGQFFISYTIRTFGSLVFATVMTTRQFLSILLSCLIFAHPLTIWQVIGTVFVFSALYYNTFKKRLNKGRTPAQLPSKQHGHLVPEVPQPVSPPKKSSASSSMIERAVSPQKTSV